MGTTGAITDASLRAFVGYDMKRAFNALQADLSRTLTPFGLRMMTFSALSLVVENPGLRPSQLATVLTIERANLVVIVDELEQRGLLTRTPSTTDRRAHALHVTDQGQSLFAKANRAVAEHDARMIAGVAQHLQPQLKDALRQIENSAKQDVV
ncbi:MAG: MarR family transcriptional regulator [Ascidiaceihabitans sp.]|nr:MarR family transcriptional regulator [Ascidiaceihabitans sp.]